MVRSDIYKNELQIFRDDLFGFGADLDIWLRIAEKHKLGLIEDRLMYYRRSKIHFSHQYNCLRTEPSDFLKILKYWVSYVGDRGALTKNDFGWHKEWIKRDYLECAGRALLKNDVFLARQLLKKSSNIRSFGYGVKSFVGFKYLMLLFAVQLGCLPGFRRVFKPLISRVL
jgi:hypothetical protein